MNLNMCSKDCLYCGAIHIVCWSQWYKWSMSTCALLCWYCNFGVQVDFLNGSWKQNAQNADKVAIICKSHSTHLGWANHTHGQLPAIIPYSKVKIILCNLWVLYEPDYYYHTASSILQFMPPPTCTITCNSKDHDVNYLGSVWTRLLSYSIQHSPNHAPAHMYNNM